ncbi:hypothetical protein IAQ67_28435 (plasmid) [Paenibacillus peoriae]|uniref:Uncharacterized protein n=1 Tax=Paenibacillus peoriae TaxID=59893 RepID=A0A7H0YH89_9BACL|nr:hypothetical protein [Paenibacillus peoriae]QNR70447.1 hypothetical protein IAQ67_28435 [Paenibacillus peoriae]
MAKAVSAKVKSEVLTSLEGVFAEARAEFEAQQAEATAAWKKELERIKEEDTYNFNKSKRDREDALELQLKSRVASVEAREEDVKAREKAIYEAEKELESLRDEVGTIPSQVAVAKKAGYSEGYGAAQAEASAEARILQAETMADKRVFTSKLENLQATISQIEASNDELRSELAEANKRVSEIATNAVTAAGQSKVTVQTASAGK